MASPRIAKRGFPSRRQPWGCGTGDQPNDSRPKQPSQEADKKSGDQYAKEEEMQCFAVWTGATPWMSRRQLAACQEQQAENSEAPAGHHDRGYQEEVYARESSKACFSRL